MLNAETLARDILNGSRPPSDAMNRADVYDVLNRGANGRLPFLGSSSKIDAGKGFGILGAVLYMMPAMQSGRESCSGRSDGCTDACLVANTGRMDMAGPQTARRRRHASFYADRRRFLADLHDEIAAHEKRAIRAGKVPAIRLNGTTDLPWHRMKYTDHNGAQHARLHDAFPNVRFYEYTKHSFDTSAKGAGIPANLHLTFSISERADADEKAREYLANGYGAAVVTFTKKHDIPPVFTVAGSDWNTTDGDAHDARFLDPASAVVILAAKGNAKTDTSGFVRNP